MPHLTQSHLFSIRKVVLAALPLFLLAAVPVKAERRGDQGYGVMAGNPSGLSAKIWLDENAAVDGAVGIDRGEFDLHATFLWHVFNWLPSAKGQTDQLSQLIQDGELPLYFGAGPRILFEHNREVGIRFPVGLSYLPKNSPWEGFAEVAPVMRLTQSFGFNGDFAVGIRYYIPAIRPMEK